MPLISDFLDYLNDLAPFDTAYDFDNVGLLVGDKNINVEKVLVSLDITDFTVDEAIKQNANLIISHHPVIFHKLANISFDSVVSRLIKNDICAIGMHTNLDFARCGVLDCLFDALKLENKKEAVINKRTNLAEVLVGSLHKTMDEEQFVSFVKESLNLKGLKYAGEKESIKTVAVSPGAGMSNIYKVSDFAVDVFISGDSKHHEMLEASRLDMIIMDATHFGTENVVVKPLIKKLQEKFSDTEFICSKAEDIVKYR